MGVLSITPSFEWAAHGLLPGRGMVRDPNPNVTGPDVRSVYDGPRISQFIWDIATGVAPVFPDPEAERLNERGTISRDYTREQQAKNAAVVKRKMGPAAKSMAQRIKRARR